MRIPERVRTIELPQFDVLNDIAASWRARGADVITLGQALPGFAPPTVAVDALRAALDEPSSHIYSSDAGTPELRAALAQSLMPLGAHVDPEREIIITAGGNQAFQLALTTLIQPGDEVVLAAPYFLNHEMAVRSVGALPIEASVPAARRFAAAWDDIAPHVTHRTRAVVLVSPSNPTGAVIGPDDLRHIVRECAERGVLVIVDETYMRFVYDAAPATAASLPQWSENVVVVGSFSKAFAITGWRCGYLMAQADAVAEAMKIQDCMIICAPVPVQRAVTAVLEQDPDYPRRWLNELKERRDFLVKSFAAVPALDPVPPTGGFFVMMKVLGCTDSRALAMDLIDQQQVVTIPGRFFGQSGEGYLRLSYGAATIDRLREAAARIGHFVGQQTVG
jgi:aspartate/methionine/tyrosine aminotransferase